MKILDYVTVENLMPKEFCEDFIQLTHKQEWEKHHWTYSDERLTELTHKTKELDIQQSTVEMQDVLIPHIQKATEIYLKIHNKELKNVHNKCHPREFLKTKLKEVKKNDVNVKKKYKV